MLSFATAGSASVLDTPTFESQPVHPVELSPSGNRLFIAVTDDHRVHTFDLASGPDPIPSFRIPVGLDPVSVRARTETELWVVNHLSDSISIIDLGTTNTVRTLLVGDEPTDVVFAGDPERAFVSVSQEDLIRIYDPNDLDTPPIDTPVPGSDPRSLTVSPDRMTVYVTMFQSGNQTTVVPVDQVTEAGGPPPPSPPMDPSLPAAPNVALVVRHDGAHWADESGRIWDEFLPYELSDCDVAAISAQTGSLDHSFRSVGTNLFNIAANPVTGDLFVTGQESFNEVRFSPNLVGRFAQSRVSILSPGSHALATRHLNEHIDYTTPAGNQAERALSLSLPLDLAIDSAGANTYVAAFASAKVAVLDGSGQVMRRIPVGNGPAGLALDEPRGRLYVYDRIDHDVSVVDLSDDSTTRIALPLDPLSESQRDGQRLFYDAERTSAHGDLSCASCHLFADMDGLAWDLGDPEGDWVPNPFSGLHPMKGPMVTQSLRGLKDTEPFHWRGDRPVLSDFRATFVELMGRPEEPPAADFADLESFLLSIEYPPNPNRELSGALPDPASGPSAKRGEQLFLSGGLLGATQCVTCHTLPSGGDDLLIPAPLIQGTQDMFPPQLRNLYERVGFDRGQAETVRGFGFDHDGAKDTLFGFLFLSFFLFDDDDQRRDVEQFLLCFDTGTHAAVGAQFTMDGTNDTEGVPRLSVLTAAADASEVGLVAKGRNPVGELRGWAYDPGRGWIPDREAEAPVELSAILEACGPGRETTFTAVRTGEETRLGIDRDGDTYLDRDELDAGSDPDDPRSIPASASTSAFDSGRLPHSWLSRPVPNPVRDGTTLRFHVGEPGHVRIGVFDVGGREVALLLEESNHAAGTFEIPWRLNGSVGKERGVYFVRLETTAGSTARRVVVDRRTGGR